MASFCFNSTQISPINTSFQRVYEEIAAFNNTENHKGPKEHQKEQKVTVIPIKIFCKFKKKNLFVNSKKKKENYLTPTQFRIHGQ